MPFLRVYTASKTTHAKKWLELDASSKTIKVSARWIKEVALAQYVDVLKDNQTLREFSARCWIEDIEDIKTSDFLMLYGESNEHLRGALVEAGVALCEGVPVVCIGKHPDYGTWQEHPLVLHMDSIEHFESWAKRELDRRIAGMKNTYLQGY